MNFPYSKQKWIAATVAALVLATGQTTLANEAKAPTTAPAPATKQVAQAVEELTLDKAIQLALKNNSSLRSQRLEVSTQDLNFKLTNAQVKDLPSEFIESLDQAKLKYVNTARQETIKKVNEYALKISEDKIKVAVQRSFFDVIHALQDVNLKKQSLTRAETSVKVATTSFEVGTRAKTDVLQAQAGLSSAQANLAASKSELEIKRIALNQLLGVDLNSQWTLSYKEADTKVEITKPEEAVAYALDNRLEIKQKKDEIKVAELNIEMIKKYSALSTYPGQIATNDLEKVKLAIEDKKRDISAEVLEAYYNLQSSQAVIEALNKAKEAQAESFRLTNLRFENGLATTLEVITAQEELAKSENSYQQAIHRFNLALVNYHNVMGK